jgi:Tfp pilus assembly protein PilN
LERVLPNANKNDFITQKTALDKNKYLISVIRKDKLDGILDELIKSKYFVFNISLGPVSAFSIVPLLNPSPDFLIPHYRLAFSDGKITDFRKTTDLVEDKELTIEDEKININYLVPFLNSICHFKNGEVTFMDLPQIKEQKQNFLYKKMFQEGGWAILLFLFMSLLANYFFFNNLRNKNQLLTGQIDNNKELLKIIQQKKNLLKTKEELFSNNSYSSDPLFAYYSDRIAKVVPQEITLNKIDLFPLEKSGSNKGILHFINNNIMVNGITNGSSSLDSWIKSLKSFKWISDVIILNYYDSNSEPAKFDLEIILNETSSK